MSGQIVTVAGTLLGVIVGLLGDRLIRRIGEVRCVIGEGDWYSRKDWYSQIVSSSPSGGGIPEMRHLRVTFLNRKEQPVTVWKMRVNFYKGGKPLEEWARPVVKFVDDEGRVSPQGPVLLPPHVPVPLTLSVFPDRDDKLREMEDVDKAVFEATLIGAGDKRRELKPPWREPPSNSA